MSCDKNGYCEMCGSHNTRGGVCSNCEEDKYAQCYGR